MAETIIERACTAIVEALRAQGDLLEDCGDPEFAQVEGAFRVEPLARAVLAAIREIDDPLSPVLDAGKCTTGHWKAMIDAVLEGGASSQS